MTGTAQRPGPLQAIGVLVTRPALQAPVLCEMLEAQGARVSRFAALDIEPLPAAIGRSPATGVGAVQDVGLAPPGSFDLIVFASANAVRHGAGLLEHKRGLPLAAIGPATARALQDAGYQVAVQPDEGFDSEGLLRHAALVACAGRRVLLIKGQGGRDLLQRELERRGATVSTAEVYRRIRPPISAQQRDWLERRFSQGEIQVITATSVEIGRNLLSLADTPLLRHFEAAHWLVPGERVGAALRRAGLGAPLLQAASAEDQALVSALVCWRSSVSGA